MTNISPFSVGQRAREDRDERKREQERMHRHVASAPAAPTVSDDVAAPPPRKSHLRDWGMNNSDWRAGVALLQRQIAQGVPINLSRMGKSW